MSTTASFRSVRRLVVVAALALTAVACGSSDDDAAPSTTAATSGTPTTAGTTDGTDAPAGPVTIEHRFGTTTLDEVPQRIVVGDHQWLDTLLALGIPTVGHPKDTYAGTESGLLSWQEGQVSADSEPIEYSTAWPLEQIAALKPDLILATYSITDQAQYDALNKIAPTIGPMSERTVDEWTTFLETGGKVFGQEDEAQELIDDVNSQIAAVADELPGLEGKTYTLFSYIPGDSIVIVADPEDGASKLMASLGLDLTESVKGREDPGQGRWQVSLERSDLLDGDVLIGFSQGGDPEDLIGWDDLPAVRNDAFVVLDYETVTGLNTPSVLSLPRALDAIHPALAAAAG